MLFMADWEINKHFCLKQNLCLKCKDLLRLYSVTLLIFIRHKTRQPRCMYIVSFKCSRMLYLRTAKWPQKRKYNFRPWYRPLLLFNYCMICEDFYYSVKKKRFKFKIILKLLIICIFVMCPFRSNKIYNMTISERTHASNLHLHLLVWSFKIGNEESRYASRGSDISMSMMNDAVPWKPTV